MGESKDTGDPQTQWPPRALMWSPLQRLTERRWAQDWRTETRETLSDTLQVAGWEGRGKLYSNTNDSSKLLTVYSRAF